MTSKYLQISYRIIPKIGLFKPDSRFKGPVFGKTNIFPYICPRQNKHIPTYVNVIGKKISGMKETIENKRKSAIKKTWRKDASQKVLNHLTLPKPLEESFEYKVTDSGIVTSTKRGSKS